MDIAWILTVLLCSVCDARLSIYLNKTVPLIGPVVPETWDEVHIFASSINADTDLSTLAAALQKSSVAVSLTSSTSMSGDDWIFSSTSTSSVITTCRKTFIFTANHSFHLSNFFALHKHIKTNKLVIPFSQYIYVLPMLDNYIYSEMTNIWVLRGVYNQLVLLRDGQKYRFYPFSIYGQNLIKLETFDFPRIPLKMNDTRLLVYNLKQRTKYVLSVLIDICIIMRCKLYDSSWMRGIFRFDVTPKAYSVAPNTDLDFGHPLFWFCWAFASPTPKKLPPWEQLLLTFSQELWLCIGAAYVCFVLAWYTLNIWSWPHESASSPSLLRSASHTIRVLMTMDWPRSLQDASRGAPQRAMLAGLMLLSLVLVTTFQSSMVEIQRYPRKSKPIDTLEDLHKSGLPIYLAINFTNWVEFPILNQLKRKLSPANVTQTFECISKGFQYALIDTEYSLRALSHWLGPRKTHISKERILCSYSSFKMPLQSPLREAIELSHLQLIQFYLSPLSFKQNFVPPNLHYEQTQKLLTLNDVKPAFYLLFAGLSTSFSVFLFECREQIKAKLKLFIKFNYFPFCN